MIHVMAHKNSFIQLTTQEIPGQILDVKGDEDYFAILSVNSSGIYNVSVLNAVGAPVDGKFFIVSKKE